MYKLPKKREAKSREKVNSPYDLIFPKLIRTVEIFTFESIVDWQFKATIDRFPF